MRLGILLILLQSMLLCAEGRAEPLVLQLDNADKQISALLQDPDSSSADECDPHPVPTPQLQLPVAAIAGFPVAPAELLFSQVRAAHTIRGPPASQ
ncbi:hypothetical protein [Microbulbifer aggregans]|uniref:hypothetical protein n=1 Tax=Microbulbifer aggregans TaxID=1769779 RepID=UPI001CFED309|nr:hypothetical protein [Microbulbifer aggregans]